MLIRLQHSVLVQRAGLAGKMSVYLIMRIINLLNALTPLYYTVIIWTMSTINNYKTHNKINSFVVFSIKYI